MTSDQIVERILAASEKSDAACVRAGLQELQRQMDSTGARLSDSGMRRLIEAMGGLQLGGGRDPYAAAQGVTDITGKKSVALDRPALAAAWNKFYEMMTDASLPIEEATMRGVMGGLRSVRAFDLLSRTCDRALLRSYGTGPDDPQFRRLYGQSLIDSGQLIAGIEVLENTLSRGPLPARELREVRGLLGRAHKQIYVNHASASGGRTRAVAQFAPALAASAKYYAADFDPQRAAETCWHGINLLAILKRAEADGVRVETPFQPNEVAEWLIEGLDAKVSAGTAGAWDYATIAEAQYAIGAFDDALQNYGRYADANDVDQFALGGTVRQLQEVWRAHQSGDPRTIECLEVLNGRLSELDRSTIALSREEVAQMHQTFTHPAQKEGLKSKLESKTRGGDFVKIQHLYELIKAASAVASVRTIKRTEDFEANARVGTAFLFDGKQLSLPDGLYLMTNAHVISPAVGRHGDESALEPGNAKIVFEQTLVGGEVVAEFDPEIVHNWPSVDHDCTILRVTSPPSNINPLSFDMESERKVRDPQGKKAGTKVSVIGHPEGQELQISFKDSFFKGDNGQVVDYGPRQKNSPGPIYLHYDTPTQGGNSGSPVFDRLTLKVIGLHHAGVGFERLNGLGGRQEANEGICIKSISQAIKNHGKGRKESAGILKRFRRKPARV